MMTCVQRRWIAWMTLAAVLFMQFAVAAYACPALKLASPAMVADTCEGMAAQAKQADPDNPGLCLQHCQQGKQSIDKAEVPTIPPLLAVGIVLMLFTIPLSRRPFSSLWQSSHLKRATAPPLSIRNCCFRI